MVEITFGLIRKANPDLNFDKFEEISVINLNNLCISSIDNMEVFSQIKELYLSHNNIERIENLMFLGDLLYLDLSFNKINSASLRLSFNGIPKTLQTLNLTGNECAFDEKVLTELLDRFPELNIAIDTCSAEEEKSYEFDNNDDDKEEEEEEEEEEKEEDEEEEVLGKVTTYDPSQQLDADTVLKSLVDRKCKLQNISSTFSLDSTKLVRFKLHHISSSIFSLLVVYMFYTHFPFPRSWRKN